MPSIVFLEVDQEDLPLVAATFPDAAVHAGVLEGKALPGIAILKEKATSSIAGMAP